MNQVGDIKTFSLSVTPPTNSGVYAYVWEFWDGTVDVTTVPTVTKTLNIGGDPTNSRKLKFTCRPVMQDGQSTILNGEITVNNPPYVVPSPSISNNDDFFPYATQIKLTAYDVENDSLKFLYYDSSGSPIGGGVSTYVGNVSGTWNGTAGVYNGTQNLFNTTIQTDTEIILKLVDSQSGTRVIDFNFYGQAPSGPVIGATAQAEAITTDATSLPDQRIGPGQSINFTVYASDPVSSNFNFLWSFYGSNGWVANSFSNGSSTPTADGSVRNTLIKDISGESGGSKTVIVSVTNLDSGKQALVPIYVNLIANTVASTCTFTVVDENGSHYADGASVVAGRKLYYKAGVTDPQHDILDFKWTIAQPSGINPALLRVWGGEVMLDTTGFPNSTNITGTLLVIDRMSGQASFTLPSLVIL